MKTISAYFKSIRMTGDPAYPDDEMCERSSHVLFSSGLSRFKFEHFYQRKLHTWQCVFYCLRIVLGRHGEWEMSILGSNNENFLDLDSLSWESLFERIWIYA